jgi:hypothetical protein
LTLPLCTELFQRWGGARENQFPPAEIIVDLNDEGGPENIATVLAADGTHLANVAYRPHEKHLWGGEGLFLC